jgi:hypothetical protein
VIWFGRTRGLLRSQLAVVAKNWKRKETRKPRTKDGRTDTNISEWAGWKQRFCSKMAGFRSQPAEWVDKSTDGEMSFVTWTV